MAMSLLASQLYETIYRPGDHGRLVGLARLSKVETRNGEMQLLVMMMNATDSECDIQHWTRDVNVEAATSFHQTEAILNKITIDAKSGAFAG